MKPTLAPNALLLLSLPNACSSRDVATTAVRGGEEVVSSSSHLQSNRHHHHGPMPCMKMNNEEEADPEVSILRNMTIWPRMFPILVV